MTTQEFSIEFDILYNNLASNAAPPLNEYEKSVFLTKAQSDIVIELYSGRNNLGLAFESSEEVREYLRPLISMNTLPISENYPNEYSVNTEDIDYSSILGIIREEIWNEDEEKIILSVTPGTHDEYLNLRQNPFRGAFSKKRAIRVDNAYGTISIYTNYKFNPGDSYKIMYLKNPQPIILGGIDDDILTIEGHDVSTPIECELPPQLHRMILDRAVLYAKQAYVGGQAQRAQQE